MGWNEGFKICEKQIITLYDKKLLSKSILDSLMIPFKNININHGGLEKLISNDGLCVDEIICKIMYPKEYKNAIKNPD